MPSVPSSKETTVKSPVCPHAGKLHGFSNGENLKTEEESQEAARNIQIKTKNSSPERKWIRPDLPSRCTWSLEASKSDSPHTQVSRSACQSDIHCFFTPQHYCVDLLLQIKNSVVNALHYLFKALKKRLLFLLLFRLLRPVK